MSVSVRPVTAADVDAIRLNDWQAGELQDRHQWRHYCLVQANHAFAVRDGDEVLAIATVAALCARHGLIDAGMASGIGRRMISVTRAVRRWMNALPYDRYTAWVDVGHEDGVRWADMLGMQREGHSRHFREGRDIFHYGWLREGVN